MELKKIEKIWIECECETVIGVSLKRGLEVLQCPGCRRDLSFINEKVVIPLQKVITNMEVYSQTKEGRSFNIKIKKEENE